MSCGLSVNLRCMRLAENTGPKNSPSGHHRTTLSGYIFATNARIDNPKKLVRQQYLLHMSSQYGELRPTNGWDRLPVWGTQAHFNGFHVLAALLHCTVVMGVSHTLQHWTRGCYLYSAGRPSRWALAHISSLCYSLFVYVCFYCVTVSFFSTKPRDWLKWPILCRVGRKTFTQSISRSNSLM